MFSDNQDFYPTPPAVIARMIGAARLAGKTVLEPSAGKGDLIDALQLAGASVCCCEIDADLAIIAGRKARLLTRDFMDLTAEQVSHVDAIYMNPPFSQGAAHILHAWQIAPPGCHIVALCNAQTLENRHTRERMRLSHTVREYGQTEQLGRCFGDAERQTSVEVSMVTLYKPGAVDDFGDFFTLEDDEPLPEGPGLMSHSLVREAVQRYVNAVRLYEGVMDTAVEMNALVSEFRVGKLVFTCTEGEKVRNREYFRKDLQKSAWLWIFSKMDMEKYTTQRLRADINKFTERQQQVPFTISNVYAMLRMVGGTHEDRMNKAILDVFDRVTSHYHDNRHHVEGWKTNSHYLLGQKFILPNMTDEGRSKLDLSHRSSGVDLVEDMVKALCYLQGRDYGGIGSLWAFFHRATRDAQTGRETYARYEFNTWYEWGFFRFKGYKKGTIHFQFLDEKVWAVFNQHVARLLGYPLPESIRKKAQPGPATRSGRHPAQMQLAISA